LLFFAYLLFLIQHYCFMSSIRAKNIILADVVAITGSILFYSFGFVFAFGARFNSTGNRRRCNRHLARRENPVRFSPRVLFLSHRNCVPGGGPLGLVAPWLAQSELDSVALWFACY
ncbi:hypothetical protein PanWU01x14_126560, partial [Parasponia andersonii]